MKLAILPLTILMVTGCATSNSARSINPDLVEISKAAKQGCKAIAQFSIMANRRGDLRYSLQDEASSRGANFVQVTSLKYSMNTHKIKATAIAMHCEAGDPQKPAQTGQSEDAEEIEPGDSLAASAMLYGLGDDTVQSPDMSDDGNPFQ